MRKVIYTTEVKVYTYDESKTEESKQLEHTDSWDELHIFADEGKVFKRISTDEVLTNHIGIGTYDDVNDFEEIDK